MFWSVPCHYPRNYLKCNTSQTMSLQGYYIARGI
nr:MAG TPA: hypothetical protein [Caudoviricetes sp.]